MKKYTILLFIFLVGCQKHIDKAERFKMIWNLNKEEKYNEAIIQVGDYILIIKCYGIFCIG